MLKRKIAPGLFTLVLFAIVGSILSASVAVPPTQRMIRTSLIAVCAVGVAALLIMLSGIAKDHRIAKVPLRQLPGCDRWNIASLLLWALIIAALVIPIILAPKLIFLFFVIWFVVLRALLPTMKIEHPLFRSCCDPDLLLRRAVIRELDSASRSREFSWESLSAALLLCGFAAATLLVNRLLAFSCIFFPALQSATMFVFALLIKRFSQELLQTLQYAGLLKFYRI